MQALKLLIAAIWLLVGTSGFCQTTQSMPEVGKMMPDFTFSKVKHFGNKRQVSRDDFLGKWLILDLWSVTCSACIQTFPKINKLQKEFADKVQILLVGNNGRYNENIEGLYERVRRIKGLDLPIAFDSTAYNAWDVETVPEIYIIDPTGVLRFIVDGRDFTPGKIRDLADGKKVSFFPKRRIADMPEFRLTETFGEDKLLAGSVLTRWSGERQRAGMGIDVFARNRNRGKWDEGWSDVCVPLYELYNAAYFGKDVWWVYDTAYYGKIRVKPILELRDTSAFVYDFRYDVGKGIYNFSTKLPAERVSQQAIMDELQRCLRNAFGYAVTVERREATYWRFIAADGAGLKLRTKGGTPLVTGGLGTGLTLKNQNTEAVLRAVQTYLPNDYWLPFMDETGISWSIDITLDGDMTGYEGARKALQKSGLDLVIGKKMMKVLVIRDSDKDRGKN